MRTLHGHTARFDGGLREIADGVHAWLQPNGSWGETNAALVTGRGESLLVDTLWTLGLTRRMLEAMQPLTASAPIRRVLNTHADGDHCWGNALVTHAEIVGSEAASEEMGELTPRALGGFRGLARVLSAARPLRVPAAAAGPYVGAMLAPFDFGGVEVVRPGRTFSGALDLDVGGRAVELVEVGPAHTEGDVIAWIPDARAVLAADILFAGVTPIMWAGPVERWIAALDRILALDPAVVLPGHGPPSGPDEVRVLRDYWEMVDEEARLRFGEGRSAEDAARDLLAGERFRAGPWAEWDLPERVAVSVNTIFRHLRLDTSPVSPVERIAVFARMGRIAEERRAARPA